MIYGYARVSTYGQAQDGNSLEAQEKQLRDNGAEEIFSDSGSGKKMDRPELNALLDRLGFDNRTNSIRQGHSQSKVRV